MPATTTDDLLVLPRSPPCSAADTQTRFTLTNVTRRSQDIFRRLLHTERDYTALLLRLARGALVFPHGAQKLLVYHQPGGGSR